MLLRNVQAADAQHPIVVREVEGPDGGHAGCRVGDPQHERRGAEELHVDGPQHAGGVEDSVVPPAPGVDANSVPGDSAVVGRQSQRSTLNWRVARRGG